MGRFGKYGESKRLERLGGKSGAVFAEKNTVPREQRKAGFPKRAQKRTQPRLRSGRRRDAPFIGRLSGKVFGIYGPYGSLVSQWFATDTTVTLVAFVDGVPVGFAMMGGPFQIDDSAYAAELLALAVEPEYQKRGVGTLLMQAVDRAASQWGMEKLFLHTATENIPAQMLFEKNGFQVYRIIRDFYPEGQDALQMGRELGQPKEGPE